MGMSCNLSFRFVAFCFSTIADPLWSCLNLLTVSYSCSKFSMSHKILHIGQLLWENSWCLLVLALKVQAWCLSGVWPYPSCWVWGVRASSATTPWVLGLPPILYQGRVAQVWSTEPCLGTHVWVTAWEMSIRLCVSGFEYMQRIPEQLLILQRALWVKLVLSPQLPFGCLLKHWTAVLLSMWSVHVWQSIKLQKILWEDYTFQNLKQSSPC